MTISGAGLAAIAAVVLLASGCGYGGVATADSNADVQNGQTLFVSSCGACHSLQAAGTSGTIGPNLDNAFAGPRTQGYAESSIENVVLDQIRLGSGPISTYTTGKEFTTKKCLDPATKQTCYATSMLPNILRGQDAIDVAAYVASVAGVNGYVTAAGFGKTGAAVFKSAGCGGCHILKAAGSTGAVGPNLDQLPTNLLTLLNVTSQVTNGGGVMPAFKGKLTAAQIQLVAQYVIANAGK